MREALGERHLKTNAPSPPIFIFMALGLEPGGYGKDGAKAMESNFPNLGELFTFIKHVSVGKEGHEKLRRQYCWQSTCHISLCLDSQQPHKGQAWWYLIITLALGQAETGRSLDLRYQPINLWRLGSVRDCVS